MHLNELLEILNNLFPYKYAFKNDRVGLQLNLGNNKIKNILVAYELNDEVINEAVSNNSNFIILFHPLIYNLLDSIDSNERVGNLLIKLIQNNINLFVVHTIFDTYKFGTNHLIIKNLGLEKKENIVDIYTEEDIGMGIIAEYLEEVYFEDFLKKCKNLFGGVIKYCQGKNDYIKRVAIVGGSGSSFYNDILNKNIDAFITADITYHNFHRANGKIWLIDIGHWEMEKFVAEGIYNYLIENFKNTEINILCSNVNSNPIKYYV